MTALILTAMINSHENLFRRGLATLRTWQERAQARQQLGSFSERDLHDIGQSWSTVAEEVNKPFWRA